MACDDRIVCLFPHCDKKSCTCRSTFELSKTERIYLVFDRVGIEKDCGLNCQKQGRAYPVLTE